MPRERSRKRESQEKRKRATREPRVSLSSIAANSLQGPFITRSFALGPPVLAIRENDNVAAAFGNASVEGGSLAAILLAEEANARLKLMDNSRSFVGHL
jgi:hypothetical protein